MFTIWHDNDHDLGRWVYLNSVLAESKEKVVLRPIPKTNSSQNLLRCLTGEHDYSILPVIKYDTPDLIIQHVNDKTGESKILFVTEFMTHTPQHHHPLQRFPRIYGASGLHIPSVLLIPNKKAKLERKNGIYKTQMYKANPLIYHIFIKTSDINNTPTLLFLWPEIDGYLRYDKAHPTAPFIDEGVERWFAVLNDAIRQKGARENAQQQYAVMKKDGRHKEMDHKEFVAGWKDIYKMTTMRIIKTQEAIKEFGIDVKKVTPEFLENEETLVFEPNGLNAPATPFRTDPYAGMLCAFDNLFCREANGRRTLNLVLRGKNIKYAASETKNIFVDLKHSEETCPFLREQKKEVGQKHLEQNQCPFTRTKQQRIYGEVADVIVFDDYVYYRKTN